MRGMIAVDDVIASFESFNYCTVRVTVVRC